MVARDASCTFANQPRSGSWDFTQRAFSPRNCAIRPTADAAHAQKCLRGRTLSFIGDSTIRDFALALASYLGGFENVSASEDHHVGNHVTGAKWHKWEEQHPGRKGLFCALRPGTLGCPKNATRSHGNTPPRYKSHEFGYTIQFMDLHRSKDWPQIREVVRHDTTNARRAADVIFLGIGVHDTYLARDNATRWPSAEACWTHGDVYQPFLDHWCEQVAAAEVSVPSREGGGSSSGSMLVQAPPLVWITGNEHCQEKKPNPAYHYQVPLMVAANRATRSAAARLGTPLLDWGGLFDAGNGSVAASRPICEASADGVHVKQWVDLVRSRLLLSYLCGGPKGETFQMPPGVFDVAPRFDRTAARCRKPQGAVASKRVPAAVGGAAITSARSAELPADDSRIDDALLDRDPPRRARPPLEPRQQSELDRTQRELIARVTNRSRGHGRVQVWLRLAANRSCLHS